MTGRQTNFRCQLSAISPLGRITVAGFVRDGKCLTPPGQFRVLGSFALVYCVEGQADYSDARGHEQRIGAGDVVTVFPDIGHRYGPRPPERWSEFYLVFEGPVFETWRESGLLDPDKPILHREPVGHWLRRMESVLSSRNATAQHAPLLEVCRLQQLLADMVGIGLDDSASNHFVSRARALLEADLPRKLDIAEVAREMGVSYHTFRKQFTESTGSPPSRYRSSRVIDRACELILEGTMNDKEIALHLGFCDEFHFSKRFKQIVGCSPREFRRQFFGPAKA